jgi:parvulin-like peptidyl-prolyl isomerase
MLPPVLENIRATEMDSLFGRGFSEAIAAIEPGTWGGPVTSGYGLHLVRVDERIDGYLPDLEEISGVVQREWMTARRTEAIDGLYERLAENYKITIEAPQDILPEAGASP